MCIISSLKIRDDVSSIKEPNITDHKSNMLCLNLSTFVRLWRFISNEQNLPCPFRPVPKDTTKGK